MPVNTHPGVYRGTVTNASDPEGLLRIKVRVPQVFGQAETNWVWPVVPVAVGVTTPAVGDPVWIAFEAGDTDRPVWVGMWMTHRVEGSAPDINFGGVVAETTFGIVPSNGAAQTLARSDHTHGSPVDPIPAHEAAGDPHSQYATDTDLADHVADSNPHPNYATDVDLSAHEAAGDPHPVYATDADVSALYGGTPTDIVLGDVVDVGTALTLARSDHRHGAFAEVPATAISAGTVDSDVLIPAANVQPGTFQEGSWVFDPVTQFIKIGRGYYGMHPVHGVNQTAASNWAAFGHWDKQASADYAFMQNAEGRTLVNASAGQSIGFYIGGASKATVNASGEFTVGNGLIRMYPSDTSYVELKHVSSSRYQVMMRSSGLTLLDSGSADARTQIRANGVVRFEANASYASIYEGEVFGSLHMRDNWIRHYGAVGMYNQTYAGGWYLPNATGPISYADKPVRAGNGMFGTWPGNSAYALFTDNSVWGTTATGLLVLNNRDTWIDSGGTTGFRITHHGSADFVTFKGAGDMHFNTDLPVLGGMDDVGRVNNSYRQVGRYTSSSDYKTNIEDAEYAENPDDNPVWQLRVRRFKYNRETIGNAETINVAYPDGLVGLVAEEVAEVMPQGANWWRDGDGIPRQPTSLDLRALMAHVVAGLQSVHEETQRLDSRLAALEG